MNHTIVRSSFVIVAVLTLLALGAGTVAALTTPFSFDYVSVGEEDNSCGFLVLRDDVGKAIGRASDTRFDLTNAGVATLTNPANGLFVTQKYQALFKNRNTVDNGDGTFSFDNTSVGSSTLYDMDGNVLLRSHGPVTVRFTYIPSDEGPIFTDQEVVFEHGAHDGYCETLTAAIG
jgi:hypothetical protein